MSYKRDHERKHRRRSSNTGGSPHSPAWSTGWYQATLQCRTSITNLTVTHFLAIIVLISLVLCGNFMQIVGGNFWQRDFPVNERGMMKGVSLTLFVSNIAYVGFFFIIFCIFVATNALSIQQLRQRMGWVIARKPLLLLMTLGFFDASNSIFVMYATEGTPEVLQTLLQSTTPIFTVCFSSFLPHEHRSHLNRWVITSMILMMTAVVASSPAIVSFIVPQVPVVEPPSASALVSRPSSLRDLLSSATSPSSSTAHSHSNSHGGASSPPVWWWAFIYFMGMPQAALYTVMQARFMHEFTLVDDSENPGGNSTPRHESRRQRGGTTLSQEDLVNLALPTPRKKLLSSDGDNESSLSTPESDVLEATDEHNTQKTRGADGATVKMVMLLGGTMCQIVFVMLFLFYVDSLPWFGRTGSPSEAVLNLKSMLHLYRHSNANIIFSFIFCGGGVFLYLGGTYLTQYNATLAALIGQLSLPLTAFVLLAIPSLNLNQGLTPWYVSLFSVVLMAAGTVVYTIWHEATKDVSEFASAAEEAELMDRNQIIAEAKMVDIMAPEMVVPDEAGGTPYPP